MAKKALLIVNLGSPDDPTPQAVSRYLKEFLMDPYVIDIPWLLRWILVHILIAPRRAHRSSHAYKSIWTSEGSPLVHYTRSLSAKLNKSLQPEWDVEFAMRYGLPSLNKKVEQMLQKGYEELYVWPLYPQYAKSSTETCLQVVKKKITELAPLKTRVKFLRSFYNQPEFIRAYAENCKSLVTDADFVIFSFHGLPEHHIKELDKTQSHCLVKKNCCDQITEVNGLCYRAHCMQTAKFLAQELGLSRDRYQVAFQSRLGSRPWIQPYTDKIVDELAKKSYKKLLVICPSFVADCLETLEEVQMGLKEQFESKAGNGAQLFMAPSLNDSDHWVEAIGQMLRLDRLPWEA